MAKQLNLPDIASRIRRSLVSDRAGSTLAAYSSQAKIFADWRIDSGVTDVPVSKVRNLYLAHCINLGKHKSIVLISSSLSYFFGAQEGGDKLVEKAILESAARNTPSTRHRAKISLAHYVILIQTAVSQGSGQFLRSAALAIVLFRGLLRIGEAQALTRRDVTVVDGIWGLFIRKSKTDQLARGVSLKFKIPSGSQEEAVWRAFLAKTTADSPLPLFLSSSTKTALTISTLSSELQDLMLAAGLQEHHYTSHSFRGGRASSALENGISGAAVMAAGRWRTTQAFQSYIRPAPLPDVP